MFRNRVDVRHRANNKPRSCRRGSTRARAVCLAGDQMCPAPAGAGWSSCKWSEREKTTTPRKTIGDLPASSLLALQVMEGARVFLLSEKGHWRNQSAGHSSQWSAFCAPKSERGVVRRRTTFRKIHWKTVEEGGKGFFPKASSVFGASVEACARVRKLRLFLPKDVRNAVAAFPPPLPLWFCCSFLELGSHPEESLLICNVSVLSPLQEHVASRVQPSPQGRRYFLSLFWCLLSFEKRWNSERRGIPVKPISKISQPSNDREKWSTPLRIEVDMQRPKKNSLYFFFFYLAPVENAIRQRGSSSCTHWLLD